MKGIILLSTILLSGCLFGFEAFFPETYHKCGSLSGWCVNEPIPEIMRWDIKDPSYNITEKCCSKKWDAQAKKLSKKISSIFELCRIDPKTGDSLINETKKEAFSCLENNGLYRYSQKNRG